MRHIYEDDVMIIEYSIILVFWVLTAGMLAAFVPKNRRKEAIVIFLFKQILTWFLGILSVEMALIEYPVRIFYKAIATSFTFEYFVYPAICVVFVLHYPVNRGFTKRFLHYFYYCTAITLIEVVLEKYTNLIHYLHWSGVVTWISLAVSFFISCLFYRWFFKDSVNRTA